MTSYQPGNVGVYLISLLLGLPRQGTINCVTYKHMYFSPSRGWKAETRGLSPAWSGSGESSLPGLQTAAFSRCSCGPSSAHAHKGRQLRLSGVSSYRTPIPPDKSPAPTTSPPLKGSISAYHHSGGQGFHIGIWVLVSRGGEHNPVLGNFLNFSFLICKMRVMIPTFCFIYFLLLQHLSCLGCY